MLCYVTDRGAFGQSAEAQEKLLLARIEQAAKAGVDWIQLREKDFSARQLSKLTSEAVRRAAGLSAILVNDRLDVALGVKAAGVHLGEHGLPVGEAKRFVREGRAAKDFLIGASVHSLEAAKKAEEDGANYVIFGPVYATPSKAGFGEPQGLERLGEVCSKLQIPVLAIGGISKENARDCLNAGAGGIAAIRLFQETGDLPEVVRRMRSGL